MKRLLGTDWTVRPLEIPLGIGVCAGHGNRYKEDSIDRQRGEESTHTWTGSFLRENLVPARRWRSHMQLCSSLAGRGVGVLALRL